jgi:hypothetical protein
MYMEGSQNQWRSIEQTQSNFNFRQNCKLGTTRKPNAKIYITKFIDKISTKRHKKSGQVAEEAPGRMRPEQDRNGIFPWKQDDDESKKRNFFVTELMGPSGNCPFI